MGQLHNYTFTNADGHEVTLRLTDADAKKRGVEKFKVTEKKAAAAPANKARSASNKSGS